MLGGCAYMAPSNERSLAAAPDAWPASAALPSDGSKTAATAIGDWTSFFPDPRLQALIKAALEHNRDMRIAVARVEEARALYGVSRADRMPNLAINASRNETQTPAALAPSGVETQTRRADVNVGLLAFELDFWGRVASLSAAAKASYLATEHAQRAFRLSLLADVADGYFALQESRERLAIVDATVASRSETMVLIAKRREVGLAGDFELLSAQGAYQSALAEQASLKRQQVQAENLLRVLVGIERSDWPAGISLAEQSVPAVVAGIPAEVLARRPDILAAEERLKAANANIGAARAAFFPRIALTGSYGSASPQLSGLFEANTTAWTFMPSISLPIFSGGRNVANLDLAQARKVIAVAEYEKAIQQAFREVADSLIARDELARQTDALAALQSTQQQRLTIAQARYGQGVANILEVLDAQRELYGAQQSLVASRRALLSASARLYKSLGLGAD
jgi:multidrug efflux system outer membrane protein